MDTAACRKNMELRQMHAGTGVLQHAPYPHQPLPTGPA
jgi:hypothetical protein